MCYYFSKTKSVCAAREGGAGQAEQDCEQDELKAAGPADKRRPGSGLQAAEPDDEA